MNKQGSTFAVPDCIVVVKPSADICIDEEFNSAAVSPADCLPCFCFDHTKECSSSSLYVSQLPPPSDQFQLITLRTDTIRTSSSARLFSSRDAGSSGAANRVYLRSPNANDGIQAYRRDFNSRSEVAYFNLPPSHRGYQLLSYGGQIKYRLTYRGSGSSIRAPDVILRGNGITLYHESRIRLEPNQPVEVTVRFLPEDWTKGSDARDSARREDLMMVLQSIEYFLIRASYVESSVLDTTITNIRMDTAIEQNYNQGQAVLVEECRCPRGYIGLSCDVTFCFPIVFSKSTHPTIRHGGGFNIIWSFFFPIFVVVSSLAHPVLSVRKPVPVAIWAAAFLKHVSITCCKCIFFFPLLISRYQNTSTFSRFMRGERKHIFTHGLHAHFFLLALFSNCFLATSLRFDLPMDLCQRWHLRRPQSTLRRSFGLWRQ